MNEFRKTYICQQMTTSNAMWLKEVAINDRLDIYDKCAGEWVIATIKNIILYNNENGLRLRVAFYSNRNKKKIKYLNYQEKIEIKFTNDLSTKIAPLNTFTPCHRYLSNSQLPICKSTRIENCMQCDTECCAECCGPFHCLSIGDVIEVNILPKTHLVSTLTKHYECDTNKQRIALAKVLFMGITNVDYFMIGIELFNKHIGHHFLNIDANFWRHSPICIDGCIGKEPAKIYFQCSMGKEGFGTFIWLKEHFVSYRPLWSAQQTQKFLKLNPKKTKPKLFLNVCKYGIISVVKHLCTNKKNIKGFFKKNDKAFNEALYNNNYSVVECLLNNNISNEYPLFYSKEKLKKLMLKKCVNSKMLNLLINLAKWPVKKDCLLDERIKYLLPIDERLNCVVIKYVTENTTKYIPKSLIQLIRIFVGNDILVQFDTYPKECKDIIQNNGHLIVVEKKQNIIIGCSRTNYSKNVFQFGGLGTTLWQIQVMQQRNLNAIGIISSLKPCKESNICVNDNCFSLWNGEYKMYCLWNGNNIVEGVSSFQKWKPNDVITILLNNQYIEYFINGISIVKHQIDTKKCDVFYPFVGIQSSDARFRIV